MIKSLAAQLDKAEAAFAPYIRFHVHHRLQQLAQGDLTPLLHRLDKRNKPILPTLLKLRALIADWSEGSAPGKDYKEYSRKQGAVQSVQHPARVVGAAPSQLFILRTQVGCLCDSDSEVRQKASFFGKSDLERTDVQLLQAFHADSFYFSYLLDYAHTLTAVSDLGDLWYREYFLEMTRCIQFPIEMSLPWILTEHLILGAAHTPLLESVVLVLDVYNDAAHRALYVLNQQYLYDEIEAEANLVVDQLYFLLSDEIYAYYKALAAEGCLDKALKGKLESLKGAPYLTVEARRMEALLAQRHIQLLGRSLNFSFVLAQNVNNKLYRDIDVAIKRFEAADARAVTELKTLLDVIEQTHSRLSQHLQLDEWDAMLSEVNESFSPSSFRGRISLHMLSSLAKDVLPNFSYNFHTHRFVPSPIAIRPMQYGKAPKQSAVTAVFGPTHAKAFENCARLTRSFFGRPHLEAYLSLGVRIADLSMLIDQLLKNMLDKVVDVSEYLDALKEGIPPCQPPSFLFRTVGAYGYFEGKLRAILDYDDLKPEVFQNFREIGNSIALLSDLSDLLELSDHFDFVVAGPFLGMPAVPGAVPEGGKGGTSTTRYMPMPPMTLFCVLSTPVLLFYPFLRLPPSASHPPTASTLPHSPLPLCLTSPVPYLLTPYP
ncbi:cytoplasmic FMR1-interacting, partial [Ochromonadaceae sp. CCMP2298]